jgi:hypothetical protein
LLEPSEPGGPEFAQEHLEGLEALWPDQVQPPLTILADADKTRLLQDLEMLGDRLLGDVEVLCDLADRPGLIADEAQHRSSARLSQRPENRIGAHRGKSRTGAVNHQASTCESI